MGWRRVVLMSGSFPNGGRRNRVESSLALPRWRATGAQALDDAARAAELGSEREARIHPAAQQLT